MNQSLVHFGNVVHILAVVVEGHPISHDLHQIQFSAVIPVLQKLIPALQNSVGHLRFDLPAGTTIAFKQAIDFKHKNLCVAIVLNDNNPSVRIGAEFEKTLDKLRVQFTDVMKTTLAVRETIQKFPTVDWQSDIADLQHAQFASSFNQNFLPKCNLIASDPREFENAEGKHLVALPKKEQLSQTKPAQKIVGLITNANGNTVTIADEINKEALMIGGVAIDDLLLLHIIKSARARCEILVIPTLYLRNDTHGEKTVFAYSKLLGIDSDKKSLCIDALVQVENRIRAIDPIISDLPNRKSQLPIPGLQVGRGQREEEKNTTGFHRPNVAHS